jgi:hypothetical protein
MGMYESFYFCMIASDWRFNLMEQYFYIQLKDMADFVRELCNKQ